MPNHFIFISAGNQEDPERSEEPEFVLEVLFMILDKNLNMTDFYSVLQPKYSGDKII